MQVRTFLEVMAVKRVLHAPGIGRPDVLIDLQSVLEVLLRSRKLISRCSFMAVSGKRSEPQQKP